MGELYALASAVVWALAVVLFRRSGERLEPLALNLLKNLTAMPLFAALALALGTDPWPERARLADLGVLALGGVLGIGIGDTLFFASLNRLGAGRQAIVDCTYSPFMIGCAALYLGERVTAPLLGAVALIALAVLVGTWEPRAAPVGAPGADAAGAAGGGYPLLGLALGAASMLSMAVGIVITKPVLGWCDAVWATSIRLVAGTLALLVPCLAASRRAATLAALRPSAAWRDALPGAVCGTFLGLLFWVLGMKHTDVSRAGVLNQTSTLFVIAFAWLVLGEALTRRKLVAIALGFAGGAWVVLARADG